MLCVTLYRAVVNVSVPLYRAVVNVSVPLYRAVVSVSVTLYRAVVNVSVTLHRLVVSVSVTLYRIVVNVSVTLYCVVCYSISHCGQRECYSIPYCVCFQRRYCEVFIPRLFKQVHMFLSRRTCPCPHHINLSVELCIPRLFKQVHRSSFESYLSMPASYQSVRAVQQRTYRLSKQVCVSCIAHVRCLSQQVHMSP